MGIVDWLKGAWAYWEATWNTAWGMAELIWEAYMNVIQGTLEKANVVKPIDENAVVPPEKRFVSRFVRHCILALLGYWWLGYDFAIKLLFLLTCYNIYLTWRGK
jgi:hypothetical protein